MDVSKWSNSAGGNTAATPDGAPEGWAPSSVNDWGRETMAAVRRVYEDAEWINWGYTPTYAAAGSFSLAGNHSALFHTGRRIKAWDGASTLYGTIASSTYSANTMVYVTLDASASFGASLSAVAVGALSAVNRSMPESVISANSASSAYVASNLAFTGEVSTATAGATVTLDLGTVTSGDRIDVRAALKVTTVSAQYANITISKDSGTSTGKFLNNQSALTNYITAPAATTFTDAVIPVSGIWEVTGNGTLIVKASASGYSGTTYTATELYAYFLKKQ